jgi:hypothetical protein
MKKKILFGLTGIAFVALLMLNISIVSIGTSSCLTLQKACMIASAEGEGTVTKVKIVSCHNEEITLEDGTKTIAHILGCAGEGSEECKCTCSS